MLGSIAYRVGEGGTGGTEGEDAEGNPEKPRSEGREDVAVKGRVERRRRRRRRKGVCRVMEMAYRHLVGEAEGGGEVERRVEIEGVVRGNT